MVDENLPKGMGQRKKRLERELSNNSPRPQAPLQDKGHHSRRDQTYTKRHRDRLLQGSLENVSSNPLGDQSLHESTLRRSRSLAISREDVFTNLEIPSASRARRSQLIPRAKLIDRYSSRDRLLLQRGISQESVFIGEVPRRKSSVCGEYAVPQQINLSIKQHAPNRCEEKPEQTYIAVSKFSSVGEEIDSLDSNYHNKTPASSAFKFSTETIYPEIGLSLPNYYPDSKCDTDLSCTDETNLSYKTSPHVERFARNSDLRQSSFYKSEKNISYDDNIVFTKNSLYEKISDNYYTQSKPRTIRGSTPYFKETDNYYNGKPRSLPNYTSTGTTYDSDSELSEYDLKYYEPIIKNSSSESNNECYDINNNQDNSKIIEPDNIQEKTNKEQNFTNIEPNPIYDEISPISPTKEIEIVTPPIKTCIQVPAEEQENNPDEFKTVVTISDSTSESSQSSTKESSKKHSHNYLRDILETQKGSKKPLQNFLSKRISRAFNPDKVKQRKTLGNLENNHFFSLPDITVSKSLQKCDKIDRKLRKCESKLIKADNTNRFIVNIGNHFDVTANSSIPVDFELKISKIPKAHKTKKSKSEKSENNNEEKIFLDAVKNLKETLQPQESTKLKINGEEVLSNDLFQREREVEVIIENTNSEKMNDINEEYQEKVHTMRNYWGSIVNESDQEDASKCKIVGLHSKVEEVKKKFEPQKEEEKPSLVMKTKQLFEKKNSHTNKNLKRSLVENPYFENNSNQYESLNPNILEIIEKSERKEEAKNKQKLENKNKKKEDKKNSKVIADTKKNNTKETLRKTSQASNNHKPLFKSRSITEEPDFDHVRYRVVKSDLFHKKIFAKCEKESQFDGLMQYLQDFSFQELLIDNNIVIIEPIRTNVQYVGKNKSTTRNITQYLHKPVTTIKTSNNENNNLKRHFFYHPIRVNREVNDSELPNPDTVKQVRQMFEGGLSRSQSSNHLETITKQTYRMDPDKDRCSASSNSSSGSGCGSNEHIFEETFCCDQFVSEDILTKIRECGTSVTYYGGRIVDKKTGKESTLTKAIMDEIQNQKKRCLEGNCKRNNKNVTFADNNDNETYQGIKFKLLKSNSCSSRLELVGTKNLAEYRNKFITKQRELINEHNLKKQNAENIKNNKSINNLAKKEMDKNNINELIKESDSTAPKIIAEEMKIPPKRMIQWGEMKEDNNKNSSNITYTKAAQKISFDYNHYDKVKIVAKKVDDMEFEPYEIAEN